ncbi:Ribosomal protein L16 [Penicillium sp. IBT 35674x]|nr:Ribosomal protein L16 [Penicillium sp. IBT 35674x]
MGPQIKMLAGPLSAGFRPTCLSSASLAPFSLARSFSNTSPAFDWLTPKFAEKSKSPKGRPHVATGGSTRGTTVVWGDYGIRMKDHDRRMPASALKIAEETIKRRLRGMNYKLYKRVSANIGVYTKGNEQRMGKGKGKFDYWTVRLPVSRVVFEVKGDLHEKVAREAFRLAGHKLPGLWEFVKKDDPPVVGITKLGNGVTLESLKRARRNPPAWYQRDSRPAQNHFLQHFTLPIIGRALSDTTPA